MTTNTKLFTPNSTDAKKTAPINPTPENESNNAGLKPSTVSPNSQNAHSKSNAAHQPEELAHQKNKSTQKPIDLNNPHRLKDEDKESIDQSSYNSDTPKIENEKMRSSYSYDASKTNSESSNQREQGQGNKELQRSSKDLGKQSEPRGLTASNNNQSSTPERSNSKPEAIGDAGKKQNPDLNKQGGMRNSTHSQSDREHSTPERSR